MNNFPANLESHVRQDAELRWRWREEGVMDEAGLIKWSRNRANRGIKAALSSPLPNRYKLEREYAQTLHLCDALEAAHEREKRLREKIASRIEEEASSQGGSLTAVVRIQAYEYVLDMLNERSYEEDK